MPKANLLQLKRERLIEMVADGYMRVKEFVGPVSQWIRECDSKTINDWQSFYYKKTCRDAKAKRN